MIGARSLIEPLGRKTTSPDGPGSSAEFLNVLERVSRQRQALISAFKESAHIVRKPGLGNAVISAFFLDVTQVQRSRGAQIHDLIIGCESPDSPFTLCSFERHQSHCLPPYNQKPAPESQPLAGPAGAERWQTEQFSGSAAYRRERLWMECTRTSSALSFSKESAT